MGRTKRSRRVGTYPEWNSFVPEEGEHPETVFLSIEEFETIRLIDYEHLTQQACADNMQVARTTVTDMYDHARFILADCLISGKKLVIAGGHYKLKETALRGNDFVKQKGLDIMRVAVPYEEGSVFQHFGRTETFTVYDIDHGAIVSSALLSTMGQGHGALSGFLREAGVDTVLCGGIGEGARQALGAEKINFYTGVTGLCDDAAAAFLAGNLVYSNEPRACDHHDHHEVGCHHR